MRWYENPRSRAPPQPKVILRIIPEQVLIVILGLPRVLRCSARSYDPLLSLTELPALIIYAQRAGTSRDTLALSGVWSFLRSCPLLLFFPSTQFRRFTLTLHTP